MAGRTVNTLLVKLGFDPKEVDQGLKKFERNLKDAGRRMESVGRSMSIGFTAPFVLGMRQAIKAFDEEAAATRKLEIALGRTSSALLNQAAAIQKTTTFADDAVINVQAYAAALGHSEAQVQKMTTAAVGLAAGLGIGLEEAMAMLHKSTLGASKGLGQLIPGVKEMTKEQLKSGAAIDLVTAKFSGYAEKLAATGAGPLKQFQNRFGDLMEQFGEAALPILNNIIDKFTALTEWFSKLSPETKKIVVELGALVALAGPVALLTGNIIKLAQSFVALGTAMKGAAMVGKGVLAAGAAVGAAESYAWSQLSPTGSGFAENIANVVMGASGTRASSRSSNYGRYGDLIPGYIAPQNSGFLAPPTGGKYTGGGGGGESLIGKFDGIARSLEWIAQSLSPFRANGAAGMSSIQPNLNPAMAGGVGMGGLAPLSGIGANGPAIAGMMGIAPDLTSELAAHQIEVGKLADSYQTLGDVIGSVMGSITSNLEEGGKSFGEYAASAIKAIAKVIQAKMMELAVSIVSQEGAKTGLVGALVGLAATTGIIAALNKIMSAQKPPALAAGGQTMGPTMALIGDNPSGKEMVLPFERTGEFARAIGSQMGGGTSKVVGVIRGRDIHLVTSQEQGYASRRGSGNLITF